MHLDLRKSDIAELAKRVHNNHMPACLKKNITLKATLPDSFRESILDEKLIERALTNLVSNAVKFTPQYGTVSISLSEVDGSAVMAVSDTGPGINSEEKGLVFEKYYRTKPAAGADGVGLWLAIVKSIVEAHGGSVAIESAPGKGSDFIINLPINNPAESR
jgi:signal transduction histidine kinase